MIFSILFLILILILLCIKYETDKRVVSERSNSRLHKGDGWQDKRFKLGMHAKCFNEIQRSKIHDIGSRHNNGSNHLKMLKSRCHHSLKDLHVHTDGAWWKIKKYSHQKDSINYPDGCIICLKSFFVGCVSAVKKVRQTVKMKGDKNDERTIKCMVCLILFSSFFDLTWSLNLCSFAVHHIASLQGAAVTSPSIQVS